MIYTINWLERKRTSTGKNKLDAVLVDPNGIQNEGVTIWEGFPNFAALMPGSQVEGDITVKQNGQYTNKTLNAPRGSTSQFAGGYAPKPNAIKAAMEMKSEGIQRAQDNKELGIITSATARDATMVAVAFIDKGTITPKNFEKEWHKLRRFFINAWTIDPAETRAGLEDDAKGYHYPTAEEELAMLTKNKEGADTVEY